MEYGRLIREAWALTWHYRFLWVLGFFAGGAVGASAGNGTPIQWRASPADLNSAPAGVSAAVDNTTRWLASNTGLVVIAAVLLVLVSLALLAISLIAQGGMAQATADLARGRPSSLRQAWRAGLHLVWRYAGLWLLLMAAAVLIAAVGGGLAATTIGLLAAAGIPRLAVVFLVVVIGLPLVAAALLAAVAVSIIVAYAQRAIAIEDTGPWLALQAGWRLLRAQPGPSLLAWLINLGLAAGAGIVVGLMAAAAAALVASLAAVIWLTGGAGAPNVVLLVVAGLTALAAIVVLSAIANTFFWHYWTLTYLRLSGQGEQVAVDLVGGPGPAPLRPGRAQT